MQNRNNKINRRPIAFAVIFVLCFLFVPLVGAASLVPSMSSNTTPSPYVVSSPSELYVAGRYDYRAYRALDGLSGTWWTTVRGVKATDLDVDFGVGNEKVVNIYRLACAGNSTYVTAAPKSWELQGHTGVSGSDWVKLDEQSGVVGWAPGVLREFYFDNSESYRTYRLKVLENNGYSYLMVGVFQLDFGEVYTPPVPSAEAAPVLQYRSLLNVTYPSRIAQSGSGDIYVANFRDGNIDRFDKYGRSKDFDSSIADPSAVAASPSGGVYIASGSGGVYMSGSSVPFVSKSLVSSVSDMVFDSAGFLYVADGSADVVRVFSPDGSQIEPFGGGEGMYPVAVAVGPGMSADGSGLEEQIFVGYASESLGSRNDAMVVVYEPGTWNVVRKFGEPFSLMGTETTTGMNITGTSDAVEVSAAPYQIVSVGGLAVDSQGRVYVADTFNSRVAMFDAEGAYFASTQSLPASPGGVSIDSDGRLLVSVVDGSVRIYSVDGADVANIAPTAPRLLSPVGGARISGSLNLAVSNSNDVNGDALVYEFVLASDPEMKSEVWSQVNVQEGESGQTSVVVTAPINEDAQYYWKARSLDARGAYSAYSPIVAFVVNNENSEPKIGSYLPESASVLELTAGDSELFSVDASDADRDVLNVSWLVDGELVSEWTSSFEFVGVAGELGAHKVVARVADAEYVVTKEWDVEVYRPNTKPVPPAVASPIGGEDVNSLRPVLTVNNSSDAERDALSYIFEVSTVSDFSEGSVVATVSGVAGGEGVTSVSVPLDLEENTLYYWRATAVETKIDGVWVKDYYSSDYSVEEASFFVNAVNDKSATPAVNYPSSGSEVSALMPELVVDRAVDLDINDKLTYQFELSSLAGFESTALVAAGTVSPAETEGPVAYASGVELEDNMTYYWRARALDGEGLASGWVTAYFFVNTSNDAPAVPVAVSPMSGAEVSTVSPELVALESTDLDGDTLRYIFEIDTSSSFDTAAKQVGNAGSPFWAVPAALAENTDYFWRVKATDGSAESSWSMLKTFFVNAENEAPAVPVVKYPASKSVVNLSMPALGVYEAADADRDQVAYVYQVSQDSSFSGGVSTSDTAGAEWIVDFELEDNKEYFWRVRSVDSHGISSSWSAAGDFKVNYNNDPPTAPIISWQHAAPDGDAVLKIINSKDLDGDALSYNVEVYRDRGMAEKVAEVQGLDEGEGETLCNVGQLSNGLYYWRARAFDGKVYGSWSGSRVLRVDSAPEEVIINNTKNTDRKRF